MIKMITNNYQTIASSEILSEYSSTENYDGIYFALTDDSEHPAFKFLESAKIAQANQHHWLRLETNVVNIFQFNRLFYYSVLSN